MSSLGGQRCEPAECLRGDVRGVEPPALNRSQIANQTSTSSCRMAASATKSAAWRDLRPHPTRCATGAD